MTKKLDYGIIEVQRLREVFTMKILLLVFASIFLLLCVSFFAQWLRWTVIPDIVDKIKEKKLKKFLKKQQKMLDKQKQM